MLSRENVANEKRALLVYTSQNDNESIQTHAKRDVTNTNPNGKMSGFCERLLKVHIVLSARKQQSSKRKIHVIQ